ncbi:hypothetical protein ACFLSA_02220 [Bacteroidota bacterium]
MKFLKVFFIFSLTSFLFTGKESIAQSYTIDVQHDDTVTSCSGTFYDSGNESTNYSNDENFWASFCSTNDTSIIFEFQTLKLAANDTLKIYDGPDTLAPLLTEYENIDTSFTIISTDTCFTFRFISNSSGTNEGWKAYISCLDTSLFYTNANSGGSWQNAASWLGNEIPGSDDTVVILNKDTLVLNDNVSIHSLIIHEGGVLNFNGYSIDLTGNITVSGAFLGITHIIFSGTVNQNLNLNSIDSVNILEINKASDTLLIDTGLTITDSLVLTQGVIKTSSDTITLGTDSIFADEGFLDFTAGSIVSIFSKWLSQTDTTYILPIATENNDRSLLLNFKNLTPGLLTASFIDTNPGTDSLPLFENDTIWIDTVFSDGFWKLDTSNGLSSANYAVSLVADGFSSLTITEGTRILKRDSAGGNWELDGVHLNAQTDTIRRDSLTGFSEFALGDTLFCPLITSDTIIGSDTVCIFYDSIQYHTNGHDTSTYEWLVFGGSIIQGQGNDTILITWADTAVDGYVKVIENNGCRTGDTIIRNVRVNVITDTIMGSDTVCINSTNIEYVANGDSTSSYEWLIYGGSIAQGQGNDTMLANWADTAVDGYVKVIETNSCGTSDTITLNVRINTIADTIIGTDTVCILYDSIQYNTNGEPSSSYEWLVLGGSIIQGQGNDTVLITWADTAADGYVKVIETNSCATIDTITINVRVNVITDTIMGSDTVCINSTSIEYYANGDSTSSYEWLIYGGSITQGQGNDSILANWADTAVNGFVKVIETNSCGTSDTITLNVRVNTIADTIIGSDTVCALSDSIEYITNGEGNSSYEWLVLGGSVIQGQDNDSVLITWADTAVNGYVKVIETNSCATIDTITLNVRVHGLPAVSASGLDTLFDIRDANDTLHGVPLGGVYSGPGMTDSIFDPGTAGTGTHEILYTYTDSNACQNTDTSTVVVKDYDFKAGAYLILDINNWTSSDAQFTTVGTTVDESASSCQTSGQQANVWFKFQAPTNAVTCTLETGAAKGTMQRQVVAIWNSNGTLVKCQSSRNTNNWAGTIYASIDTLTPGNWYWISVEHDANNGGNTGTFSISTDDETNFDYFSGAYELTDITHWQSANAAFDTEFATDDESVGSCGSGVQQNVWFKFQATSTAINIELMTGDTFGTMDRQIITLWDSSKNEIACKLAPNSWNWDGTISLSVDTLVVDEWYFISVDHDPGNSGNNGTFSMYVDNDPSFDHKSGAFELEDISNWCSADAAFSNENATPDTFTTTCSPAGPLANVWFKFQATTTSITIDVKTGGSYGTMNRQEVAIWNASGQMLQCKVAPEIWNWTGTIIISADTLAIGNWYYISVDYDDSNSGNTGTFSLCIDNEPNFDTRSGAVELINLNNWCSANAAYDNSNATPGEDTSSCDAVAPLADVWFKFQATTNAATIKVKTGGSFGTMNRQKITLWDSIGNEIKCEVAPETWNWTGIWVLSVDTLTVDDWYFISVDYDDSNSGNTGTFTLCIDDAPAFDYRSNAKSLPIINNWCSSDAAYSNENATPDEATSSCHPTGPLSNVWFKFQATTNSVTVDVKTGGSYGTMNRQEVALWDSSGNLITCFLAPEIWNWTGTITISVDTLTVGKWYFISVDYDNSNSGNWGTFSLCVDDAPAYDARSGAVELTDITDWCSSNAQYDNSNATGDTLTNCSGSTVANVWFKFQANTTAITIDVRTGGAYGTMNRQVVSLWDSTGNLISCKEAPEIWNWTGTLTLSVDTLVNGDWYFISVDYDESNSGNIGTFSLCADNQPDYDFRTGAVELADIDNWQSSNAEYDNSNATAGDETSTCLPAGPTADVWFKFQATTNSVTAKVITAGTADVYGTMDRQIVTLWDTLGSQIICSAAPEIWNWGGTISITVDTLTIGEWYFISVDNGTSNSGNTGTFTLYVDDGPEFDFRSGAEELTDLDHWCSSDAAYDNSFASADEAASSCYGTGPLANIWFWFEAVSDTAVIKVVTGGTAGTMDRQNITLWNASETEIHCVSAPDVWNWGDTLSLSIDTLTPGNSYWISVDNFTTNSGNTGTFAFCINNTKDAFYSINDGAWDDTSTWSNISHVGDTASRYPSQGDVVYIQGHSVTVNDNDTAAAVYINVNDDSTELIVDSATLEISGRLTMTNSGNNYVGIISVVKNGTIQVNNDLTLTRAGGDKAFKLVMSDSSILNVGHDFDIAGSGGTVEQSVIQLNNKSSLNVDNDFTMTYTGGTKITMSLNDSILFKANRDIVFSSSSPNSAEIEVNDTSVIKLYREIDRGTPKYGIITFNDQSTLLFNGISYLQKLNQSTGDGGDSIRYQNVIIQNSKVTSPQVTLNGPVSVYGKLSLIDGVIGSTSSNLLTLKNSASLSGGSTASFIDGPIKKIGNTAFTFPTGEGTNYQPLSITAPSNLTDEFTAEYFYDDPDESYDTDSRDDSLYNISTSEYWSLDKSVGASEVLVTIGWNSNSDCVYDIDSIKVAVWNGSTWKDYGHNATTGTTAEGTVQSDSTISLTSNIIAYANSLPNVRIDSLAATYCDIDSAYEIIGFPTDANGTFSGFGISDSLDGTATFNPTGGGGETETITYSYTVSGCTNEYTQDVTINSLPTTSILGGDSICEGSSVELDIYFTGVASWSFSYTNGTDSTSGSTSNNPYSFETSDSGYYYVYELTDANGCVASNYGDSALVGIYLVDKPVITPGGPTTICQGDTLSLTSSAGYEYYWSTSEETQEIFVTEDDDYNVYTITENNCVSEISDAVSVIVDPLPFKPGKPKGDEEFCASVTSSSYTTSGALYAEANEYDWALNPDTAGTITGNTTAINVDWNDNFSGPVRVKVRGHNDCGYGNFSDSLLVTLEAAPVINLGNDTSVCFSHTLDAENAGATYLWSTSATSQTINVTTTGTYWVRVTSGNGCINYDTIDIIVNSPDPTILALPNPTCFSGDSIQIGVLESYVGYAWTPADSLIDGGTNQTEYYVPINPNAVADTVRFKVTITDAIGCNAQDSIDVIVIRRPITRDLFYIPNEFDD